MIGQDMRYQNKSIQWVVIVSVVLLMFCSLGNHVLAQVNLDYQKRAGRSEGRKPKPVSGFDIELLSAHIAYQDAVSTMGEHYQIRFFLDEVRPVHLLVREVDYRHFYWLDKVEPESPWTTGFSNVYRWPTADVIRHLKDLSLYDLGVVVRLNDAEPRAEQTVAPVLLYQSHHPAQVSGYEFVFKLREAAEMKGAIYQASTGRLIVEQDLGKQVGDRPFAVQWDLHDFPAEEGRYKLVVKGYMLRNNNSVAQVVHFYHRPQVQ